MSHQLIPDSDDFRAGLAYAAHLLMHAVNSGHGEEPSIPWQLEPNPCCRQAVIGFAAGMAQGMEDGAGRSVDEHDHAEG